MDMTKGNVEHWYSMNEVCIRDEMISRQIGICGDKEIVKHGKSRNSCTV